MLYRFGKASVELYSTSHPYVWYCPLESEPASNFVLILGSDNLITTFSVHTFLNELVYTCSSWLAKLLQGDSYLCFTERTPLRTLSIGDEFLISPATYCYSVNDSDIDCREIFLAPADYPTFPPLTLRSKDD